MNRREFLGLAALPLAQLLDHKDLRRLPGISPADSERGDCDCADDAETA